MLSQGSGADLKREKREERSVPSLPIALRWRQRTHLKIGLRAPLGPSPLESLDLLFEEELVPSCKCLLNREDVARGIAFNPSLILMNWQLSSSSYSDE